MRFRTATGRRTSLEREREGWVERGAEGSSDSEVAGEGSFDDEVGAERAGGRTEEEREDVRGGAAVDEETESWREDWRGGRSFVGETTCC